VCFLLPSAVAVALTGSPSTVTVSGYTVKITVHLRRKTSDFFCIRDPCCIEETNKSCHLYHLLSCLKVNFQRPNSSIFRILDLCILSIWTFYAIHRLIQNRNHSPIEINILFIVSINLSGFMCISLCPPSTR